jgi:hypothetical protein
MLILGLVKPVRFLDRMLRHEGLSTRIPFIPKYSDGTVEATEQFCEPVDACLLEWSLVHDTLRRLSLMYSTCVSSPTCRMGYLEGEL